MLLNLFLLTSFLLGSNAAVEKDKITSLPGWDGPLPSNMYSGYLKAGNSRLFYWYVESESTATKNVPLTVWFNGGPGCSSLGGFLTENGPFKTDGTNLQLSEFRWSLFTNMLWFENPVGVGFSYSKTLDYNTGDDATANDNLLALEDFFRKYPELIPNDLHFAGESYGGIYIPMLAQKLLQAQDGKTWKGPILKGIAVGNGCSGNGIGACSDTCESIKFHMEFLLGLSYISADMKLKIAQNCNWDSCMRQPLNDSASAISSDCWQLLEDANALLGAVNIYNVYSACTFGGCASSTANASISGQFTPMNAVELLRQRRVTQGQRRREIESSESRRDIKRELGISGSGNLGIDDDTPPDWASTEISNSWGPSGCIDSGAASQYLMTPAVQKAIHARPLPDGFCWGFCNQQSNDWNYVRSMNDEPKDVYPSLFGRINVLIYNGDVDDCVPYTDNSAWTSSFGYTIKKSWHPWYYHSYSVDNPHYSQQLGGYIVEYESSTWASIKGNVRKPTFHFATVRGSGHMVPQDQPNKIFDLYSRYIDLQIDLSPTPSSPPTRIPTFVGGSTGSGVQSVIESSQSTGNSDSTTAGLIVLAIVAAGSIVLAASSCFFSRRSAGPDGSAGAGATNPMADRLPRQEAGPRVQHADAIPAPKVMRLSPSMETAEEVRL